MRYESAQVPFEIRDGWPEPLTASTVVASEAGITLGGLLLSDTDWASLRTSGVLSVRIDEHPELDGYVTRHPDGAQDRAEFVIPTSPVVVPMRALQSGRDFSDWVWQTHGALGRLLVWDRAQDWWIVNEPDLELQLVCAHRGRFEADPVADEPFSWLPSLTGYGRSQVAYLTDRYRLDSTA